MGPLNWRNSHRIIRSTPVNLLIFVCLNTISLRLIKWPKPLIVADVQPAVLRRIFFAVGNEVLKKLMSRSFFFRPEGLYRQLFFWKESFPFDRKLEQRSFNKFVRLHLCSFKDGVMNGRSVVCMAIREKWITRVEYKTVANSYQRTHCLKRGQRLWILISLHRVPCFSPLTSSVLPLLQALVLKVGMDSIMASYFALFEVINHSFGKGCICARSKMKLGSVLACSHMRDFRSPLSGDFITWTLFLNKKGLNRPAGEFNCSPGEHVWVCVCVCVAFASARAGNFGPS